MSPHNITLNAYPAHPLDLHHHPRSNTGAKKTERPNTKRWQTNRERNTEKCSAQKSGDDRKVGKVFGWHVRLILRKMSTNLISDSKKESSALLSPRAIVLFLFLFCLSAPTLTYLQRNWLNCRQLRWCAVFVVMSLSVHFIGPKYVQITFSFSYHCSVQTHLSCVGLFTCCWWSVLAAAFFVNKTFRSCLTFS